MGLKAAARNLMIPQARASIMWILLLHACHICAGNTTVLSEFETMLCMLMATNTNIYHTELPAAFILNEKNNKKCQAGHCNGGGSNEKCT
eukprot:2443086-Ditylum_brightwellii.AAC.4